MLTTSGQGGRLATAARSWHLVTAMISFLSLIVQFGLTVRGVNVLVDDSTGRPAVGVPTRLLRLFSYFTVQSNLLVIISTFLLGLAPHRDGCWFRLSRIAGLTGITVTFVVYLLALRPHLSLSGWPAVTDFGLHIAAPILAVVGWLVFGPRPRFTWPVLTRLLIWPALYLIYSVIHGATSGWYPYPFVDVTRIGYGRTMVNAAIVLVLLLAVGAAFVWLDGRLRPTEPGAKVAEV